MGEPCMSDMKGLKELASRYVMLKGVIALAMRYSGCTYQEIGDALGVSRQRAERIVSGEEEKVKVKQI